VADREALSPGASGSSPASTRRDPPAASSAGRGSFDRDTAVWRLDSQSPHRERARELRFEADVSADWRAGRGPHGGYLAAMVMRALTETVADPARAPRSLTIHYARAPEPGAVHIQTTMERAGRSLSTLSARMEQDGRLIALALAAFSVPWTAPQIAELAMPEVAPADVVRETSQWLRERVAAGLAPQFLSQLVVQPRTGGVPFAGSDAPMEISAWLGVRDPARPIDAISLALFSDALFSAPFVRLTKPATSPTVDLTVHFRACLPRAENRDPPQLCLGSFRSGLVNEGFFDEDGIIWAADGTLLAQSRQLAILMPLQAGVVRGARDR